MDGLTPNDSPSILDDDGDVQYSYIVLECDGKKGYRFTNSVQVNASLHVWKLIKDQLQESLKEHILCDKFHIGYIEAGRQGVQGKMRWIFSSENINDMYQSYKSASKTEIILWCDMDESRLQGGKRPLLQKRMKAAVRSREHPVGRQSVK